MSQPETQGYGRVAILAAILCREGTPPDDAWRTAAAQVFPDAPESRKKSCPRDAFLGLAEEGLIAGVSAGSYTRSRKNKRYALDALAALEADRTLVTSRRRLWWKVMQDQDKQHNGQMDVVLALWGNGDTRTA